MNSEIGESEALVVLGQVYQTQAFTFSSMFIAVCIGLIGFPVFVLNLSLSGNLGVTFILRLIFFGATLLLADTAVYCISKTIYSSMLLREILHRLKLKGKGKSSMEYLSEMKFELRHEFPVFEQYKMGDQVKKAARSRSYKLQIWGSVITSLIIPAILFSFIWWNHDSFLSSFLGSELAYLFSLLVLFRYIPIM